MTPPSPFRELLERRVVLLDGGLGSMLIAEGLRAGRAPEWWVLEHPDRIAAVHRQYAEAGSDVVCTCTFGANPLKLETAGLGGRCGEINATAVQLARESAAPGALVAGDVGPTGKFFPPMGEATDEQLRGAFVEQCEALAAAGADLIAVETMYDLREALAAVRAARTVGLPVMAAMTFEPRKRGFFTLMGDRVGPSLQLLHEAGAEVVGFNCSVESGPMVALVREAVEQVGAPILAQPNAGQPRPTPDGVVYDADPETFVQDLLTMVGEGARVVGGCCGTDPTFIARARRALDG